MFVPFLHLANVLGSHTRSFLLHRVDLGHRLGHSIVYIVIKKWGCPRFSGFTYRIRRHVRACRCVSCTIRSSVRQSPAEDFCGLGVRIRTCTTHLAEPVLVGLVGLVGLVVLVGLAVLEHLERPVPVFPRQTLPEEHGAVGRIP